MKPERYKLDYEKAKAVVLTTLAMMHDKKHPFNRPDVFPDEIIPAGMISGSSEHALYLALSCSLDSQAPSPVLYKGARALFSDSRIDITKLFEYPPEELEKIVKQHMRGVGDMHRFVHHLQANSRLIQEKYAGDARNMKQPGETRESIQATIQALDELENTGPGKAALIIKNMARFGIWDYPHYAIPFKIDLHARRISVGKGVVELFGKSRADWFSKPLQELYEQVCQDNQYSCVDFKNGLWAIGYYICNRNRFKSCSFCDLKCSIRPYEQFKGTYMFPDIEMRNGNPHEMFQARLF